MRHALVTGAGRGLGRAIALALAMDGRHVSLLARSAAELDLVQREIRSRGGSACVAAADACDADGIDRAFHAAEMQAGVVTELVTAAGINRPGALHEAAADDLKAVLEVNVLGTLLTCRAFGRALLDAGLTGAVVTLSSQMGSVGYPGRVAYCASKHAVNGLSKALALEWAPRGIRVNSVAPTFVRTPMTAPMLEEAQFEADVLARIPLGRIGTEADVVGAVRYLLSDEAALVTGHVLAVDGGWTAQ